MKCFSNDWTIFYAYQFHHISFITKFPKLQEKPLKFQESERKKFFTYRKQDFFVVSKVA